MTSHFNITFLRLCFCGKSIRQAKDLGILLYSSVKPAAQTNVSVVKVHSTEAHLAGWLPNYPFYWALHSFALSWIISTLVTERILIKIEKVKKVAHMTVLAFNVVAYRQTTELTEALHSPVVKMTVCRSLQWTLMSSFPSAKPTYQGVISLRH